MEKEKRHWKWAIFASQNKDNHKWSNNIFLQASLYPWELKTKTVPLLRESHCDEGWLGLHLPLEALEGLWQWQLWWKKWLHKISILLKNIARWRMLRDLILNQDNQKRKQNVGMRGIGFLVSVLRFFNSFLCLYFLDRPRWTDMIIFCLMIAVQWCWTIPSIIVTISMQVGSKGLEGEGIY